jgi:GT2 family glycosyltransferase
LAEPEKLKGNLTMQLSIIFVNYRSSSLIIDSIRTINEYNKKISLEYIVVNNASGDDSKEKITQLFPEVIWLEMGYNAGFSRANNAGLRIAKGDTFLLLNPDTLSIDNSIELCYQKLNTLEYVAAGVQQLNGDHTPQISGNFFVKGGLNHVLPIPYWGGLIRWFGYKMKTKVPNVQEARAIEEVDWISGAFLMVKETAIKKAGLMDEDFFLYAEEVEWCNRLKKTGKLCIFGDLHIIHLEGATINKDQNVEEKGYYNLYDKKGLQLMVSNHLRVRKQYGVLWFMILLLNYSWGFFFFWCCSTFHHLFRFKNPFAEWNRIGAFGKNMIKLWSLAPKMIRNQPHFYKMW